MAYLNFWRKSKLTSSLLLSCTLAATNQIITCTFTFKLYFLISFRVLFFSNFFQGSSILIFQNSKIYAWLVVSTQTCKELGSHYSCTTTMKSWTNWKTIPVGSQRTEVTGQTATQKSTQRQANPESQPRPACLEQKLLEHKYGRNT